MGWMNSNAFLPSNFFRRKSQVQGGGRLVLNVIKKKKKKKKKIPAGGLVLRSVRTLLGTRLFEPLLALEDFFLLLYFICDISLELTTIPFIEGLSIILVRTFPTQRHSSYWFLAR